MTIQENTKTPWMQSVERWLDEEQLAIFITACGRQVHTV